MSRTTSSIGTPRRRYTVAVWSAKSLEPVRVVAGDAQREAVDEHLGVAEQVAQAGLVVAVAERRVGVDGDLERPRRQPAALRTEARGAVREPGLEAARRQAERGVAHGAKDTVRDPRRVASRHERSERPRRPPPPSAPRLDRAPGERYRGGQPPSPRRRVARSRRRRALADDGDPRRRPRRAPRRAAVRVLGQVDLGFGLVAIAVFVGWAVALALRVERRARSGRRRGLGGGPRRRRDRRRPAPRLGLGPARGRRPGPARLHQRAVRVFAWRRDPRRAAGVAVVPEPLTATSVRGVDLRLDRAAA